MLFRSTHPYAKLMQDANAYLDQILTEAGPKVPIDSAPDVPSDVRKGADHLLHCITPVTAPLPLCCSATLRELPTPWAPNRLSCMTGNCHMLNHALPVHTLPKRLMLHETHLRIVLLTCACQVQGS